jgi:hypothetical protein
MSIIPDWPEAKATLLGYGFSGTVYEVDEGNIKYVTKVQKCTSDTSLASEYGRLIKFNEDIAKYHPNRFMRLVNIKIIKNAKHVQNVPVLDKYDNIAREKANAPTDAYIANYVPVLEGSYKDVKHILTPTEELEMMKSINTTINILLTAGYRHRDVTSNNIMYKKVDDVYCWYLIDYGSIWHDSFKPNAQDRQYDMFRPNDKIGLAISVIKNVIYGKARIPKFAHIAEQIHRRGLHHKVHKYLPKKQIRQIRNYNMILVLAIEILHNEDYASICLGRQPNSDEVVTQTNEDYLMSLFL